MKFFYPLKEDPENDPILEQLPRGYNDAAIIFYPFVQMPNEWSQRRKIYYYPTREEFFKYGKPLSWETIRRESGIKNIADMSKAVTAGLMGVEVVRSIYQRADLAQILNNSLGDNIYYPLEGQMSLFIMDDILKVLASNGAKMMKYTTLYNEKGTYEIKDITLKEKLHLCSGPITIADKENWQSQACKGLG
ncbi:DUF2711 domain-containing protein [Radiobacillus kanasensis]|uniref:DUF2711 family protein n=1 Tax=Radiobacillus kanasensis TaxID=2844358 RepID=UPI001E52F9F5|nr:DUF2711 family protein [Radiobacillus kanasensis]UFT98177.1 DUF2711 domain-containing protein [Radiobacillus kanasensis]